MSDRQYSRADVDYSTWYTPWMKSLARRHSAAELQRMMSGAETHASRAAAAHQKAVAATTSMAGQSMRRAHARNVCAASGDYAIALNGAIEIHELFPEHAAAD